MTGPGPTAAAAGDAETCTTGEGPLPPPLPPSAPPVRPPVRPPGRREGGTASTLLLLPTACFGRKEGCSFLPTDAQLLFDAASSSFACGRSPYRDICYIDLLLLLLDLSADRCPAPSFLRDSYTTYPVCPGHLQGLNLNPGGSPAVVCCECVTTQPPQLHQGQPALMLQAVPAASEARAREGEEPQLQVGLPSQDGRATQNTHRVDPRSMPPSLLCAPFL